MSDPEIFSSYDSPPPVYTIDVNQTDMQYMYQWAENVLVL